MRLEKRERFLFHVLYSCKKISSFQKYYKSICIRRIFYIALYCDWKLIKICNVHSQEIQQLIHILSRLPGLGPRSGRRVALHLLKKRDQVLKPLAHALLDADAAIVNCEHCFLLDTSSPCSICSDIKRDPSKLCIVADVSDVWAIERAHSFRGTYHVLGGLLSAMDAITPQQLTIQPLLKRFENTQITEVILALSATIEGQTTLHYLADILKPYNISITTLAHGVPVGGELDYLDDGTLTTAFSARRAVA